MKVSRNDIEMSRPVDFVSMSVDFRSHSVDLRSVVPASANRVTLDANRDRNAGYRKIARNRSAKADQKVAF